MAIDFQAPTLVRARHLLETQGRFPGGALPGDISESWLRSLSHGLDPLGKSTEAMLSADEMQTTRQRHADLIRFARPELELLFDQISGSNFMIALGSPEGVVLDTLADVQFDETEAGRSVVPGSVWTEELRGTNAFGMCLATRRPAQVYGGEHFLRAHDYISCISAPIFDGQGNLAGVLDASSCMAGRQQHTAALVQMSASNIENCLMRSRHDRRIVLQFHPRAEYLGTLSVGMLVLEEDFTVHAINRKGELFLTWFPDLVGESFDRIFESRFEDVAHRLAQGETLRLRDRMGSAISIRAVANRASFALAGRLRPSREATATLGGYSEADGNPFKDIVIDDPELRQRLRPLPEAARRVTPICLIGETGTGKEIVARLAHAASERGGPFIVLDGRVLDEADFTTAFFGLPGGEPGLLAQASGGSLFLDELTALPIAAQATLARVLDSSEYRHPVTGALLRTDVMVIAASSEDLDAAIRDGRLLPALRYRIDGLRIVLPPLRDRADLEALALRFARSVRPGIALAGDAMALLKAHDWPGNMNELRAVVTRAALRAEDSTLGAGDLEDLLPALADQDTEPGPCKQCAGVPWKEQQCRTIQHTVSRHDGNVSAAARTLGMSRTTVYKHLTTH